MKLAPERKRLVYLIGTLVVLGGYSLYTNVLSGPSSSPAASRPIQAPAPTKSAPAAASYSEPQSAPRSPAASSRANEEFRPSLKPKRPEDRVDPMATDPTLRLDLLAKVQSVGMEGGHRNLFQVGTPPPAALPPEPKVSVANRQPAGPQLPPPPPQPPPAPQAPPITLKYYGYSSARGDNRKHAFFLDGDDILVGAEGDVVKKRYRVVRIGVNSVVMEDTQFKHEQTLQLQEEAAAG
ncbi:MAG TPA: hypothetical protein VKR61_14005 [Bryobacteraceae bacterium]|nr:hypothetical protein [Bryobacteraceae bacterium]